MNYSTYNYKIKYIARGYDTTWLFLPGGPGLGSEYLENFCAKLTLPGNVLLLDFPKDGANTQGLLDFNYWQDGLIDLLQSYPNPILVTHSFSGMFVLNTPEIEPYLAGLVLMNTTTANSFFTHVSKMQQKHNLPDLVPTAAAYHLTPSNETYRKFWDTYKHYCFTPKELNLGEQMIPLFAFNSESYHYAIENFYADYQCQWHPKIPTMTIASEEDFICPPQIFIQDKQFQAKNIMNKLINKAGHCPWILNFEDLQRSFDEYVQRFYIELKVASSFAHDG